MAGEPMDVIEGQKRHSRGRALAGVTAGIVLAGLSATLLFDRAEPPRPQPAVAETPISTPPPSPSPSARSSDPEKLNTFVPPTKPADGDKVTVALTFPDGSTAKIRYPEALEIAELGVRPVVSAQFGEQAVRELFAPPRGEQWFTDSGGVQLRTLPGVDGDEVKVWRGNKAADYNTEYLMFGFGRWRLAVADDGAPEMLFDERTGWSQNLAGRETDDGYLVLDAKGDLDLVAPGAQERGEPAGPQLRFGEPGGREVWLIPDPDCRNGDALPGIGGPRPDDVGALCRESVLIAAAGDGTFVTEALRDVEVLSSDID